MFSDLSNIICCSLLRYAAPPLEEQYLVVVIEKLLISLVMLKKEFVTLEEVAANKHFPSSTKFFEGENEKRFHLLIHFHF